VIDFLKYVFLHPLSRSRVHKFLGRVSVAVWLEALPLYQPVVSGVYKTRVCCLLAAG